MARLLALRSLPRTNPGNRLQYKRVNGPYQLYMIAGGGNKLPFGNIPRLLLAWVTTEAVRTQSRELILGSSLSEFMGKLGMDSVGGARTRLRNQMRRLFNAHVQLVYEDKLGEASVSSSVTSRTEFWWDPKQPDVPMLWDSKIELGWDFFNEIIRHPMPIDMNTLKALKRCALGLDLYLWLSYRTFTLKRPLRLSWRQLYCQFGVDPAKANNKFAVRSFREKALRELKKIKLAWPSLNYSTATGTCDMSRMRVIAGHAAATHWLTLARPDCLVSVNGASARGLGEASDLPQDSRKLADRYSDLLNWLYERPWFNEFRGRQPDDPLERDIWNCRAALVDAFVYKA